MTMTKVNPQVVLALMRLRNVPPDVLGNLLHVPYSRLASWLGDDDDQAVPFEVQLECLRLLGIHNGAPRSDLIHYWRIQETFTGSTHELYADLLTVLGAFGDAQVVHIARETDNALSWSAKAHFGLRFGSFYAMLEISGNPFRQLRFNPEVLSGLSWVEGVHCVMLDSAQYDKLEPGAMQVGGFQQHLTYNENKAAWDTLQDIAAERKLDPKALASIVDYAARQLTGPAAEPAPAPMAEVLDVPARPFEPAAAPAPAHAVPAASLDDLLHARVPGAD